MKNLKLASLLSILMVSQADAAALSFTGNLNTDNDRFYTTFDVTANSSVTLRSLGYAGGTNAAGTVLADGGFDSQLFLFTSTGTLLEQDDDSSDEASASSGLSWDALITLNLTVGSYVAVLTQYNSDFVSGDLFTGVWTPAGVSNFVDVGGNQRTSAYAFDISGDAIDNVVGTNTNNVPEPASLALLALGFLGLGFSRKAKKI